MLAVFKPTRGADRLQQKTESAAKENLLLLTPVSGHVIATSGDSVQALCCVNNSLTHVSRGNQEELVE